MTQGDLGVGPGGGEALVDGTTLGVGSRGSGTPSSGDSCGIPGLAPALGSGTDLWVVRTEPTAVQRL
jgi:hypothetical protein